MGCSARCTRSCRSRSRCASRSRRCANGRGRVRGWRRRAVVRRRRKKAGWHGTAPRRRTSATRVPKPTTANGSWSSEMSHFTKCALKMTNLAALKKALADLNLKFTEAEEQQLVQVRGYRGDKLQAKISIDMGRYDIGVVENAEGTYDIVADWWGVETTK